MLLKLYCAASAIEHAVAPQNQKITWLERGALNSMNAQDYRIAEPEKDAVLLTAVRSICKKINVPEIPKVIVYEQQRPNAAFIHNGTVIISTGLLTQLNQKEIEFVLAHEFRHKQQLGANILAGMTNLAVILFGADKTTQWYLGKDRSETKSILKALGYRKVQEKPQEPKPHSPWFVAGVFMVAVNIWSYLTDFAMKAFVRRQEFDADRAAALMTGAKTGISALDKLEMDSRLRKPGRIPSTDPMIAMSVDYGPVPPKEPEDTTSFAYQHKKARASHPEHAERVARMRMLDRAGYQQRA